MGKAGGDRKTPAVRSVGQPQERTWDRKTETVKSQICFSRMALVRVEIKSALVFDLGSLSRNKAMQRLPFVNRLIGCCLLGMLSLVLAPPCQAGFIYTSFPRAEQLALNGRAALTTDSVLRVANNTGPLAAGSAFFTQKVDVANGFSSEFTFRIHTPSTPFGMADGLAFLIQNAPSGTSALGLGGGFLGYTDVANNLVVEFDIFETQPNSAHIAVHSRGTALNSAGDAGLIGSVVPALQLVDQQVHTARVEYTPSTLSVFLDNQFVLSRNLNLQ
jgi:hypothetical protein